MPNPSNHQQGYMERKTPLNPELLNCEAALLRVLIQGNQDSFKTGFETLYNKIKALERDLEKHKAQVGLHSQEV